MDIGFRSIFQQQQQQQQGQANSIFRNQLEVRNSGGVREGWATTAERKRDRERDDTRTCLRPKSHPLWTRTYTAQRLTLLAPIQLLVPDRLLNLRTSAVSVGDWMRLLNVAWHLAPCSVSIAYPHTCVQMFQIRDQFFITCTKPTLVVSMSTCILVTHPYVIFYPE